MSAFIDCAVCRARLIHREDAGPVSDADFTAWAENAGWTIAPTRCGEHAGAPGQALVEAAVISRAGCEAEHDSSPWSVQGGLAIGGGTSFGSGPTLGRARLAPRDRFCQEQSHYWLGVAA
jgi:hypothetical protein